jgi:hypothetical protein
MSKTRIDRLRIGQFTGWHGDRADGMDELLKTGVDILTGDYLAELTMLVLRKNADRGGKGYVDAVVGPLSRHLATIAANGVKVITNAGGLDPHGLATEIKALVASQGLNLKVAHIVGDDVRDRLRDIADHLPLVNLDTGEKLSLEEHNVLTANAYLGAWPIVEALNRGADIVVCPRMTDASLIVGPAAWAFGWKPDEYDRLAGAVVAGHIIECGAQSTGGNFSFFAEHDDLGRPGMPVATLDANGDCVLSKSVGSGGLVDVDTVKAQLFYEIGPAAYQNPDVVTDFSSVAVESAGDNLVLVRGSRGFAPTSTTKLSLTYEGGYRNTMTIALTGAHVNEKLNWLRRQIEQAVGPPESFDGFRWTVVGPADVNGTLEQSTAFVIVNVRDKRQSRVDRTSFSDAIVQIATSSIPGFYMTAPPQKERLYGVQWPTLIEKRLLKIDLFVEDDGPHDVSWSETEYFEPELYPIAELDRKFAGTAVANADEPTVAMTFGSLFGSRSGDKGGVANLGVWARNDAAYQWLRKYLTVSRLGALIPEADGLKIERYEFSNLRGLNFLLVGFLEQGVSACTRVDPQAKGLGEYLGSRIVDIPASLLA